MLGWVRMSKGAGCAIAQRREDAPGCVACFGYVIQGKVAGRLKSEPSRAVLQAQDFEAGFPKGNCRFVLLFPS